MTRTACTAARIFRSTLPQPDANKNEGSNRKSKTMGLLAVGLLAGPVAAFAVPTATNLDGSFALGLDANIFNSTTVAHTTVRGSLSSVDDVGWYSFSGAAGATFFADHDNAINGDTFLDSMFSLFRSSGELIAFADDSASDPGSTSQVNAFLGQYVLPAADTYFLAVSSFANVPSRSGCSGLALTRPDDALGGVGYSGCADRSFAFNNDGLGLGTYTIHFSLSSARVPVPEPGTLALLGLGLAGLGTSRRRKA